MENLEAARDSSRRGDLGRLLRLAWPVVLSRATQAVIGFTDALMVAPLGEQTLAAVTTGALDVFSLIMLPLGTMFILQSFAAQLRGSGRQASAGNFAYYGLIIAAISQVVVLALLPLLPALLSLASYEPEVEGPMQAYMTIRLYSVLAMVGVEALNNWYAGLENTRIGLVFSAATMIINVALCYALIQPRFGLPGYGAEGSAWAACIATYLGFFGILTCFLLGVGHDVPRARPRLRMREFIRTLRFGLPSGINYFLEFAAFVLFINVVVGHLGTTTLAAFNVVFQLNMISFMPAFGVGTAGAILVGEAIGRGERDLVPRLTLLTLSVTGGWMLFVGLVYIIVPAPFIRLFAPPGENAATLVAVGTTMLALSGVWQLFDAITMTVTESLRAAGDTAWPMVARILLAWLGFAPLGWYVVKVAGGGPVAAMLTVIVYLVALAALLALRFRSGAWRRITLVEPSVD